MVREGNCRDRGASEPERESQGCCDDHDGLDLLHTNFTPPSKLPTSILAYFGTNPVLSIWRTQLSVTSNNVCSVQRREDSYHLGGGNSTSFITFHNVVQQIDFDSICIHWHSKPLTACDSLLWWSPIQNIILQISFRFPSIHF